MAIGAFLTGVVARRHDCGSARIAELTEIDLQAAKFALIVGAEFLYVLGADVENARSASVCLDRSADGGFARAAELIDIVAQATPFALIVGAIFLDFIRAGNADARPVFERAGIWARVRIGVLLLRIVVFGAAGHCEESKAGGEEELGRRRHGLNFRLKSGPPKQSSFVSIPQRVIRRQRAAQSRRK
jgi:hypothetical protein